MNKINLIYGSLLHDIGKINYRGTSERAKHSKLGGDFIKSFEQFKITDLTDCIRYHHAQEMTSVKSSKKENALFYLTYMADNISSGMDRRPDLEEGEDGFSWDKKVALSSVFNVLHEKEKGRQTYSYPFVARTHEQKEPLNFPNDAQNQYTKGYYDGLISDMKPVLAKLIPDKQHINSLLQMMESLWSYVPSSTDKTQLVDISLYDHSRTTAAIASAIYDYFQAENITDYQKELFDDNATEFYEKKVFLMMSFDMSGVQSFIYNISGSKALKSLRARSFYLDMLLEYLSDNLLDKLELSRANLIYSGGGHAYLLLSNTEATKKILSDFEQELKAWFLDKFKIDLFLAMAYTEVSGNDLMNKNGHYRDIYRRLSKEISAKKANRYTVKEILALNGGGSENERECRECKRSDLLIKEDDNKYICGLCHDLQKISSHLIEEDIFVVANEGVLDLPFGKKMSALSYTKAEKIKQKESDAKLYTKNISETGRDLVTKIDMGDYTYSSDFQKMLQEVEKGINRLGVLRADVDNLGQAFINGIPDDYLSISRTATFSRAMSRFFKNYLNQLLEEKHYKINVIYAGGDDLFMIGAWQDILDFSLELKAKFAEFTQGKLTLSAGIGMFREKYPVARMAALTGDLEDAAKDYKVHENDDKATKNAVTLFDSENVFSWETLETDIFVKIELLTEKFATFDETGNTFIYRLIALLRGVKDDQQINIARLAYTLSRMEEKIGSEFAQKLYDWANSDRKTLIMALEIYVLKTRER
ncbi:type III-A CRISPR-associated protein Cas10/Csm1 [Lactococcus hodotermopsidis]|uniref:CRISPR system single-strand-specific deoxyribonuclease Cas10/Csm1 (subtype III-A) n=1 Tax=Pseudolactococcus hodotermopsidis TaxID=2709157 RepID=A0A6A0BAL7_9LACT|nr:type III-A CRISPR-associated protein Cas10/Csm1 [Lactococcus hodotermopsidis]GFH41498.1 type III-A CRISPR-associated protein Cas10/Csm1 [Lactococcus hodotermopsidis]